jgi:hypothetical protein
MMLLMSKTQMIDLAVIETHKNAEKEDLLELCFCIKEKI